LLTIFQRFSSPADLAIIVAVLLIILGPKRLPQVGNEPGQAMRELRKITNTNHMSVSPAAQSMFFIFLVAAIVILLSNG